MKLTQNGTSNRTASQPTVMIGERIFIDSKHLSRIELGKSFPYMETLEAIASALEVEIKDLFDFMQLSKEAASVEGINRMLQGASEDQVRQVYKFIKHVCN